MDVFFTVTESCKFEATFKATIGPIMVANKFSTDDVKAAYKLLTRNFWKGQLWLMKWVFTGGPVRSFKAPNGAGDFKKAKGFCDDFVGTVELGGKVMTKLYAFPKVVAAGKLIVGSSYLMKAGCIALGLAYRTKFLYMKVRSMLKKLGITIPMGKASWRASHYNEKIGLTRRCPSLISYLRKLRQKKRPARINYHRGRGRYRARLYGRRRWNYLRALR